MYAIIIIIAIIILLFATHKNKIREHYWGPVPYDKAWNIFKCLSAKCIKDESYKCYLWCNNLTEERDRESCKLGCANDGDIQFKNARLQYYHWGYQMPELNNYTLYNDDPDIVEERIRQKKIRYTFHGEEPVKHKKMKYIPHGTDNNAIDGQVYQDAIIS